MTHELVASKSCDILMFVPVIQSLACSLLSGLLGAGHGPDDVRVSGVSDGEGAHTEVLSTRGAQLVVVPSVVVDSGLGQHGVILDLRLAEGRSVGSDDDQLALAVPQGLEGLL